MKYLKYLVLLFAAASLSCVSLFADDDEIPFGKALLPNPSSDPGLQMVPPPPLLGAATIAASPATATNFVGAIDDGDTRFPPDTQGAVGTNYLMVMLNTFVKIQDRSGSRKFKQADKLVDQRQRLSSERRI